MSNWKYIRYFSEAWLKSEDAASTFIFYTVFQSNTKFRFIPIKPALTLYLTGNFRASLTFITKSNQVKVLLCKFSLQISIAKQLYRLNILASRRQFHDYQQFFLLSNRCSYLNRGYISQVPLSSRINLVTLFWNVQNIFIIANLFSCSLRAE